MGIPEDDSWRHMLALHIWSAPYAIQCVHFHISIARSGYGLATCLLIVQRKIMEVRGTEGLSNDDFRKLLATPRPHMASGGAKGHPKKGDRVKNRVEGELVQAAKQPKPMFPAAAEDGYVYRDRAEERRRGMESGVEESDKISMVPLRDVSSLSVEESKYLGGDLEHTHLVKGLDYALLSKTRAERSAKMSAEHSDNFEISKEMDGKDGGSVSALPVQKLPSSDAAEGEVFTGAGWKSWSTKIGQQVLSALQEISDRANNATQHSDMFLPNRTTFLCGMREEDKFEVPMIRTRAKEDCQAHEESSRYRLDESILEEICNIMQYTTGAYYRMFLYERRLALR